MKQPDAAKFKRLMAYRWIVWGILVVAYVIGFFHRLATGVVKDDLIKAFQITETTYANLGAAYFYMYVIMQIPAGILADSLGARKTVTLGAIIAGIGSMIFGFAPSVALAFFGRLLVGLGVSVVFISILKIQSKWFREREFATMSGITSFVGNMGGAMAQTPLAIIVGIFTWRYTFIVIGLFTILIAVLCYILVKDSPADIGLPSIEEAEIKVTANEKTEKISLLKGLMTVVSNKGTWPAALMFTGGYSGFVALTGNYGGSYISSVYGVSKVVAANYMMVSVISMAIGSIVIGSISDRIKKRKTPIIIFSGIYAACWAVIVFAGGGKPPIEMLMPLMVILGFTSTSFILSWACVKEINPPQIAGMSSAAVSAGGFLGVAILPTILGRVFDTFGKTLPPVELYQRAFMYCFIASLLGLIAALFIKETNCRNIYEKIS